MPPCLRCVECGDPVPRPYHHLEGPSRCDTCINVLALDVLAASAGPTVVILLRWAYEAMGAHLEDVRGPREDLQGP